MEEQEEKEEEVEVARRENEGEKKGEKCRKSIRQKFYRYFQYARIHANLV